jgi:hypothetical protein
MTKVVLLYRTDLPYGVETRPWHIRTNRLAKPLLELELLLLTEHRLASGQTLKLEHEVGFLTSELVLDLGCHPIEPCGDLLLVSAIERYLRTLCDQQMTCGVEDEVVIGEGSLEFVEVCTYPNGTLISVGMTLEVREGRILRQLEVVHSTRSDDTSRGGRH